MIKEILQIEKPEDYKCHFAVNNGDVEPIEIMRINFDHWRGWSEWSNGKNDFNRKYILSFAQFPHKKDLWLFGGIFEVLEYDPSLGEYPYKIRHLERTDKLVARLVVEHKVVGRSRRLKLENILPQFTLHSILENKYGGRPFPGFTEFEMSLNEFHRMPFDWQSNLSKSRGVYLLTDPKSGKQYVGSAYGENGFWGRWASYAENGHGGNVRLKELVKGAIIPNYTITILEVAGSEMSGSEIINRESHWKRRLGSRPFGLNEN